MHLYLKLVTLCTTDLRVAFHQIRDIDPMLVPCWTIVCDAGPTLVTHGLNMTVCIMLARSTQIFRGSETVTYSVSDHIRDEMWLMAGFPCQVKNQ